ncbi:uncharacterized protein LOC126759117 [Bactrocera neohumeralis]|uniref:uncharacterized protein LOC126759117 n=1 Tax=Bactrocera neohumeralis TaxID=98809 RepID=UPI0021656B3D|nr:uncharacterized protein LOC126759117 [Bactrocera neohumeralis]
MLPRLTCFCLTTVALHFVGCTSIVLVNGKPPKKLTPQSSRPLSLEVNPSPIALDTNEVLANAIQNYVSSYATKASYVSIGDYKDLFCDSWCDSEESSYFSGSGYTVQCDDSWCDSEESSYFNYGDSYSYL